MTRLVMWRHGVTDWNELGVFQGQTDIPLNERGLAQARAAAPYLAEMRPTAIYCSPMRRAQQTAESLSRLVGRDVIVDARLAEIDVGTWTGSSLADVMAADPVVRGWVLAGADYKRSPTGETMGQVGQRAGACLREIAAGHDGQTVVVVSHGGAIRMGIADMLGWSYEMSAALGGVSNCGWCVLSQRYGRWRIEVYNCTVVAPDPSVNTEI